MSDITHIVPANDFPFEDLCKLFEELYKINDSKIKFKKIKQFEVLTDFVENFRVTAAQAPGKKDCTFFPILRLLLPDLERERSAYNLKETKLGSLFVKVLALHKTSSDAMRLTQFRTVGNSQQGSDFPSVAYFVLKNRAGGSGDLMIKDINDALDKISNAEVGNSAQVLNQVFTDLIRKSTAKQLKWFLRIVLKNLKISMGSKRILSAYHPDAYDHYEIYSSILKVCEELDESNTRPAELGVEIFSAISPMLSDRLDLMNIARLSQDKTYQIETKFDGERFQIHMNDGKFEYFSRRGFRYSNKFGSSYHEGNYTPLLKHSFNSQVTSFVLDGEMMGWHKQKQCFSSKGINFDVKKITDNSVFSPCFCAYDILYYNGRSLIGARDRGGMPLNQRLEFLDKLFEDITGVIYHSKRYIVKQNLEIVDALNKANREGEEGIVVKEVDSYYLPRRRNGGWYKVKPEYTEGTMEDLDMLIVGGDYAENKKQGVIKSFMVALADGGLPGEMPSRWLSIGRVSTGLSFEERENLCIKLQPHWKSIKMAIPDCLVFGKEKPDLWILPEHSIILQIRASELIRSKEFVTDYTFRFARVLKIRDDKPIQDAMTLEQLNSIVKGKDAVVKLSTGDINIADIDLATALPQKRKRQAKSLEVADQFKAKKICDVPVTSQSLAGKSICVLSDDEEWKKEELEKIVQSQGGVVVQNYNEKTWCCIAGRKNVRVNTVIASQKYDVVTSDWLKCLPKMADPITYPPPIHMMAMKIQTRKALSQNYDKFGDSYQEFVDDNVLKLLFNKMDADNDVPIYLNTEEMMQLDEELFLDNKYSYLRGCFIHHTKTGHRLAIRAEMYGSKICQITSPNLTHVITSKVDKNIFCLENVSYNKNCKFVSEEWLEKSLLNHALVSETEFLI